jgi:tRNA nucleotidyltransferase (CCA-adding enzyme)
MLSDTEFYNITTRRGTDLLAVVFGKPDVVDDLLYPQLFMLHNSIKDLLSRHKFSVLNGDVWAGDSDAAVVLEMEVSCLPPVKKHAGPPVWEGAHAGNFKQKYLLNKGLSRVYIENGRYVVDVPRQYTDPVELIKRELLNCRLGKHVGACIRTGFEVRKDEGLQEIDSAEFRFFLKEFFKL